MIRFVAAALAVIAAMFLSVAARAADPAPPAAPAAAAEKPRIDIVFCIDCSTSMGPVIETAKQKVWAIVNQTARARPVPELRIGMVAYGNAMGPFHVFPLSSDLDQVYKDLLTIKEEVWHDEYVGLAVHRATADMNWAEGKRVYKAIYVVGNETARQGPEEFDYTRTARAAIAKGIVVNAIYCGTIDYETATPTWKEMARLADGAYAEIAGQGGAVVVATPFDRPLAELSAKLNATYVGYGLQREAKAAAQEANDAAAARFNLQSAADRAGAKATRQYDNSTWDLVDASRHRADFDLAKVKESDLPEELRKMTPEQRKAYVDAKAKDRDEIARQIRELSEKREAYVKEEVRKKGLDTDKAFDDAVRRSITEQAAKRGFEFDK